MSDKVKIKTKVSSFEDVQKSLQDIEKNFNKLSESVNKEAESEQKETEGKSGDTKATNEGTNAGNDYKFEVKTDKGWQSPILKPHYDSGWTSVVKDATYKFKHHLGSKILFIQIFFKISTGEVIHMGHYGLHEMRNSPTNEDNGITVQMTSNSGLDIGTATYGIVATDNIPYNAVYTEHESGHLRVLLWKTGVKA